MQKSIVRHLLAAGTFAWWGSGAAAQSFFVSLGTDPATGVDRGSASQIQPVERTTAFATLSSDAADAIGPWIGSVSFSFRDVATMGDQIDFLAVVGGPSENERRELAAAGLQYRIRLGDNGMTLFANADASDFRLGTVETLPLDIEGRTVNLSAGLQKRWSYGPFARGLATLEFSGRDEKVSLLGATVIDEDLRVVRAAYIYEDGAPYTFRRRFAASVSKGIGGLGASEDENPTASGVGVHTDFLRIAGSAEISVPLSGPFLLNAGAIGQWTDDSLPVSQRCGYGTNSYARGFDRSFVNADKCLGGRVEVAFDIERPSRETGTFRATQAFVGLDGGLIEDNANAFLLAAEHTWSSISTGMRALWGEFLGEIALTQILDEPAGAFEQDETRLWLRMAARF